MVTFDENILRRIYPVFFEELLNSFGFFVATVEQGHLYFTGSILTNTFEVIGTSNCLRILKKEELIALKLILKTLLTFHVDNAVNNSYHYTLNDETIREISFTNVFTMLPFSKTQIAILQGKYPLLYFQIPDLNSFNQLVINGIVTSTGLTGLQALTKEELILYKHILSTFYTINHDGTYTIKPTADLTLTFETLVLSIPIFHLSDSARILANKSLSLLNHNIIDIADPINANDAANKSYVDKIKDDLDKIKHDLEQQTKLTKILYLYLFKNLNPTDPIEVIQQNNLQDLVNNDTIIEETSPYNISTPIR